MRRREFITLIGSAAASWPLAARAQQQAKVPRIGIIDDAPIWDHFRQGLRDLGYIEGQNIAFEYRSAEGMPDRLAAVATELARVPVDVILTYGTPSTAAAKQATTAIPIVMIAIGDPVRAGFVASLAPARRKHHWKCRPWPGHRHQTATTFQGSNPHHFSHRLPLESG